MTEVEEDLKHEKALRIKEYTAQIKEEADKKARDILSIAIQRSAADHVAVLDAKVEILGRWKL